MALDFGLEKNRFLSSPRPLPLAGLPRAKVPVCLKELN